MHDFPPTISAYTEGASQRPDTRSPNRFLWWLIRQQGDLVLVATVTMLFWVLPTALTPWIFGRVIDDGILAGDPSVVAGFAGLLLVVTLLGALSGVVSHTVIVRSWLIAGYGTTRLVGNKAVQLGHVLTRRSPTGEVLSISGSDGDQFGGFLEIFARSLGNLVAYLLVATIVLQINLQLGLVVLLVAPLLVLVSAPLLRPLSNAQMRERSRDSTLTSKATDIVGGLRILRGIGGERIFGDGYAASSQRVRAAGVQAGAWTALVEAVGVLLSGLFVVALMWLGVRQVQSGALRVGELVTFLGYALFLVQPIRTFFEFAQKYTRTRVSARKAVGVLRQPAPWPVASDTAPVPAEPSRAGADREWVGELYDEASGLRVRPGRLTMVVSGRPDDSAALADRLGRYLPGDTEPVPLDGGEEIGAGRASRRAMAEAEKQRRALHARDLERARGSWGVTLDGVDLADLPITEVRRAVLVSDTGAHVFAGTLQEAIDPHGRLDREDAEQALHAAAAEDVYDVLPGGWQGVLEERGRGLSGGQRQRLVLARALATDVGVLVLVEPTSAVDAHTEAVIAQRLPRARSGRTTVVMTASPLMLHQADEVALLEDGVVTETGTHAELARRSAAYRRVVLRGEESAEDAEDTAPLPGAAEVAGPEDPAGATVAGPEGAADAPEGRDGDTRPGMELADMVERRHR